MRIFVFGNINSGKTSVCSLLQKVYPDYIVYSIDNFRKKYGKGDFESDVIARDKFVQTVSALKQGIVECTGLGPLGRKLADSCKQKSDLILHLRTPLDICLERIKLKDFSEIPYPPFEETLENTIIRCHKEFEQGDLEGLWSEHALDILDIDGSDVNMSDIQQIPLKIFSYLNDIVQFVSKTREISALISIGSLARRELSRFSDIDLFIISDLSVNQIRGLLDDVLDSPVFMDLMGNKVTIRYTGRELIEIHCVKHINELKIFYRESQNKDIRKTILKGDDSLVETLQSFTIYEDNHFDELVDQLVSELVYYLLSLDSLRKKNDRYKFYFHNNIIVHNYIRLKALTQGVYEYNYLPIEAEKYLSAEEKEILFFKNDDKMKNHFCNLMGFIPRFLKGMETLQEDKRNMYLDYLKSEIV